MSEADQPAVRRKRNRSPKHPAIDLEAAISNVTTFHSKAWDHPVTVEVACEFWGLTYGSGAGNRAIAALLQFGLLKGEGSGERRKVQITGRGLDLVSDPEGVTEARTQAVRDAALAPPVYKEMWDRWGPRLPTDDKKMTPVLLRDLGFNPRATSEFLRNFRATVAFAGLDKLAPETQIKTAIGGDTTGQRPSEGGAAQDPQAKTKPTVKAPMEETTEPRDELSSVRVEDYTIPLRGAGTAVLSLPVPLTRKNYENLKGWLTWAEDSLVADEPRGDE